MRARQSHFSDLLVTYRLQAGISQKQLAACLGMDHKTIERWERGKKLPKSQARLVEIARCLGLTDKQKEALLEAALFYPPWPLWNAPPRNPFFTGQESLLTQLHDTFAKGGSAVLAAPTQALTGLGGIGKTQLALEYAYRYRDDYQAVLWTQADSPSALASGFVTIAHLLGLPEKDDREEWRIIEGVLRWLRDQDRWLLIFDNVEDPAIVTTFLPKAGRGHILITARVRTAGDFAQTISLDQMEPSQGALLLLRRAGVIPLGATLDEASSDDRVNAENIAQLLGDLPLALDQAGAYIHETACGLQDYLDLYQAHGPLLLRRRGRIGTGYPESVATTFLLAFERVKASDPSAAELLQLCALLSPDKIPEELIIDALTELNPDFQDPLRLDLACKELLRYSLIHRDPDDPSLSVHRLIQTVLREEMGEKAQQQWAERVVRAVGRMFPNPQELEAWLRCERYLPQAQACATLILQWNLNLVEAFLLLNRVGSYLYERALYPVAEHLMTSALSLTERERGPNHPDVATELNNLAVLYDDQGRYDQAEPLLQRALSIRERVMGLHHPVVANSLNNLAMHYYNQGKYEQAEPLLQRALSITERNLGPDHSTVATNQNNLALLYKSQGKYERATTLYQRALSIREQTLAPNHPDTAQSLNNLAGLYLDQGRQEEAAVLYQRALSIFEQTFGVQHPSVGIGLNNLAELYRIQGKQEEAAVLYQRALSIFEQAFGADHPTIAQSLNNMAMLYRSQNRNEQAEPLYQRAFSIFEHTLGPGHPDTMRSLNSLAMFYRNQERYEQAVSLYLQELSIFEQQLGPRHPNVAQCLNDLALLYKSQGKHQQAEPLYQRALLIRQQIFGPHHPDVAQSLNNLAALYTAQRKYEQAEPLYQRAISIFEQQLGPRHPNVAQCLNNLASLYYNQGKYEQAKSFYVQAISLFEQAIGPQRSKTVRVQANYAILLRKMKRDIEATQLLAQEKLMDAQAYNPPPNRDVIGRDVGIDWQPS